MILHRAFVLALYEFVVIHRANGDPKLSVIWKAKDHTKAIAILFLHILTNKLLFSFHREEITCNYIPLNTVSISFIKI